MRARPARQSDALLRALAVLLLVAGGVLGAPQRAEANLQQEMDQMFNSMAVAVPPSAFSTARRGVLSGGGVDVRNRIVNERLVSFVPPSFEAGCGGIDFFAGSFSFINAAQFTALMRAVAMNAAGYAFQLALRSMCPECASVIETLQRKIQELSQFFANSCQLAQGIVNDGARALGVQVNSEASLINTISGVGDVFQSFTNVTGQSPARTAVATSPARVEQRIQGNVVWRALRNQSAATWFAFGTDQLLEVMMNVSGTVIIGDLQASGAGPGENFVVRTLAPRPHLLSTLVEGGTVTIEGCDTAPADGCRNLITRTVTVVGFRQMFLEALVGGGGGPGVIQKINANLPLTTREQQILNLLPNRLGGLVVRLANESEPAGRTLAEAAAPQLALEMARGVMNSMLSAVEAAVGASEHPHTRTVVEMMARSRSAMTAEAQQLQTRYGSLVEVARAYTDLLAVLPSPRWGRTGTMPASFRGP
jgi:conjugative transfer pilus assembly protein TraH